MPTLCQQDLEFLDLPTQQLREDFDTKAKKTVHQVGVAEQACLAESLVFRPWPNGHLEVQPCDVDKASVTHLLHHQFGVAVARVAHLVDPFGPQVLPVGKAGVGGQAPVVRVPLVAEFLRFDPATGLEYSNKSYAALVSLQRAMREGGVEVLIRFSVEMRPYGNRGIGLVVFESRRRTMGGDNSTRLAFGRNGRAYSLSKRCHSSRVSGRGRIFGETSTPRRRRRFQTECSWIINISHFLLLKHVLHTYLQIGRHITWLDWTQICADH